MVTDGISGSSRLTKEDIQLLNSFDPATRRIAFIGFKSEMSETAREAELKKFTDSVGEIFQYQFGHFYNGPRNNKMLYPASYLQFHSEAVAQKFLSAANGKIFRVNRENINIKSAVTKTNLNKNWAMRKAEELIKAHNGAGNKIVKSCLKQSQDLGERC